MMDGLINNYKEKIIARNIFSSPDLLITQMLKNSLLGIVILNNDLEFIECNDAALRYLGLHEEDRQSTLDKCSGDAVASIMNMTVATRLDKTPRKNVLRVPLSDGTSQDLYISVSLLTDSNYRDSGFSVLVAGLDAQAGIKSGSSTVLGFDRAANNYLCDQLDILTDDLRMQSSSGTPQTAAISADADILYRINNFVRSYCQLNDDDQSWYELQKSVDRAESMFRTDHPSSTLNLSYRLKGMNIIGGRGASVLFAGLMAYSERTKARNVSIKVKIKDGVLVVCYKDNGYGIPKEKKEAVITDDPAVLGPDMFLVGKYLDMHKTAYREIGVPGEGLNLEMMVPPSRYSIDFN
ncbi:MAG: PAS domain-containing protein [Candidatus Methanomethylophilus sp.]|nr:PAS domain-containing protein [Methanomethylophilus sp.]MDD4222659.1 PAS domain-containing protein [Methanomethylophilus sp.]